MNPKNTFVDIVRATTVNELLNYHDESFIYCVFRTLLNRDPDEVGKDFYLKRLRSGEQKSQIIIEILSSQEGQKTQANIDGLKSFVRQHKIKRMFGLGRRATKKILLENKYLNVSELPPITERVPLEPSVKVIKTQAADTQSGFLESSKQKNNSQPTIWIDLTTSLEWKEGVVGIIRAELEIAFHFNKLAENVRFSMQIENGFVEIPKSELTWLLDAENVVDGYMKHFNRYKNIDNMEGAVSKIIALKVPNRNQIYFPFQPNDVVISVGWMDSQKETYFSKVKEVSSDVYLCYLIYDIILLLEDTTYFYHQVGREKFKNYVKWISHTCDFILYGGETAKNDTEALQKTEGWPIPPSVAVKFGTDIMKVVDGSIEDEALKELGITGPFVMTVGSMEPRKNHDALYRAYVMAQQLTKQAIPQLVICGRPMWRVDDLVDTIERDPRLQGHVIRISPTDTQLAILYKRCLFTLLPSMYEGWSLTLPESLGQGKFCLCTDTPPLREIGQDLVDYAPKWDVRTWAEKIIEYSFNTEKLKLYEKRIKSNWPDTSWGDSVQMIFEGVSKLVASHEPKKARKEGWNEYSVWSTPTIWMDITLTYIQWRGGVSGIIRTELSYARYLKAINPETRFFASQDGQVFEVYPEYLQWLFNDSDLTSSYMMFQSYWTEHEQNGTGNRNPLKIHGESHSSNIKKIPSNSIVFYAGIDFGLGCLNRLKRIVGSNNSIMFVQLIYDFTPILFAQFHTKETCAGYLPFIEHVSEKFDFLVYGGRTAQRDGVAIQQQNGWRIPPSDFIEFGSNFEKIMVDDSMERDQEILSRLGVSKRFIMTVGTIEPRKNHEMLYKAYVTLLQTKHDHSNIPQMLFIGKKGWKVSDFMATFEADERIKGKIIILSPSDEELDTLYRHCMFTLLPSFYEGWSLTLPESLSYGKLCLTSDVDPLKETGRDLVEYINPLDTYRWAERIYFYATHPDEVSKMEKQISENWAPRTWQESTQMLVDILYKAHENKFDAAICRNRSR